MTRKPFPKLVASEGKTLREFVPLTHDQFMAEVAKMREPTERDISEAVEFEQAVIKESRAVAEQLLADPEVKAAMHRSVLEKATKHFARNLDGTGLLDENGMVKR